MTPLSHSNFEHIFYDNRSMILLLTGATDHALDERALELGLHYDKFLSDYDGSFLVDAHVGFAQMLQQWPSPWPAVDGSALNGLTFADFHLAWAWEENTCARRCLADALREEGMRAAEAMQEALVAAVSAAKSLGHAKLLLTLGERKIAQDSLPG